MSASPAPSFDHYARLVRRLLRAPVGLVTLVQQHDQVFVGADGLSEPEATTRRTPVTHSFCQIVATEGHPLVVRDARREALADHPAVTEMGVVAYAGWPIYDDRRAVGSLCAVEYGPREWTTDEVDVLRELAHGCSTELQRGARLAAVLGQLAALEQELGSTDPDVADRVATIRRSARARPPEAGRG